MAKKVKNAVAVVPLIGDRYRYYVRVKKKAGAEKLKLKKYNPITRKREIFKEK